MSLSAQQLPDSIDELKEIIVSKSKTIDFFQLRIQFLEEKNRYLRSKLFGRKSEKHIDIDDTQLQLFDELEEIVEQELAEEETIVIPSHKRKKTGRKPLPQNLPRVDVIHDLSDEEKVCTCGCEMDKIGEEVSEKLDIIPAKVRVIRNIRLKYACKKCEGIESDTGAVKTAPVPAQILPKSIATSGLLSHIVISKFADALPLYRQEKIFSRTGIDISRATMANWLMQGAQKCQPLAELLEQQIRSGPLINIDETTVQVLNEPGRSNTSKSYMWVFRGGPPDAPVLMYQYHPSRSGKIPDDFLGNYNGYVQTDAYSGYDALGRRVGIILVGCWSHARRKFAEVIKARQKNKNLKQKTGSAEVAINFISKLYAIEKHAKTNNLSFEQIYDLRQEKSKPILNDFKKWLDQRISQTPPKGLLGQAMSYTLNQWSKLIVYIEDGRLKPDNNLAENAIRPFVFGRKNWLFSGHPRGAKASAIFFSLIETAKANGLEPYSYLRYIFNYLPLAKTTADYEKLLPQEIDQKKLIDFAL
ncbi:MAG: IS66 family transposase [Pseudomonadota bacterium]